MDINKWYKDNTFHFKQFKLQNLIDIKRQRNLIISLCFPTLNEANTIGSILTTVKKDIFEPGLVDEVVIIDSDSTDNTMDIAKSIGFKVYKHKEILPELGTYNGKGEALWKSIYMLKGDIIIWCDSDIKNFSSIFIYGILAPLLPEGRISYVKAFYERPLLIDGTFIGSGGGRVTEILIRPLLNLFYPELSKIIQPLSGEYAGRREIFENIPFFTGYGVEIGMLIEIYKKFGLGSIAQVDVQKRIHRNQPLSSLSKMSFAIIQAFLKKMAHYNEIDLNLELSKVYNQPIHIGDEYFINPIKLEEYERPPMNSIKDHLLKGKQESLINNTKSTSSFVNNTI